MHLRNIAFANLVRSRGKCQSRLCRVSLNYLTWINYKHLNDVTGANRYGLYSLFPGGGGGSYVAATPATPGQPTPARAYHATTHKGKFAMTSSLRFSFKAARPLYISYRAFFTHFLPRKRITRFVRERENPCNPIVRLVCACIMMLKIISCEIRNNRGSSKLTTANFYGQVSSVKMSKRQYFPKITNKYIYISFRL